VTHLPLEVHVEELSAEFALAALMPAILPDVEYVVRRYQGKHELLKKLPQRLLGYAKYPGPDQTRVVVLIDRDDDDCHDLRHRLDAMAEAAGLRATGERRAVLNRVAVEELEAWFFGDPAAISAAYPKVPATLSARRGLRDPGAIAGGTWDRSRSFQMFRDGLRTFVKGAA
jgi:Domain of unknown function (DUF4276)